MGVLQVDRDMNTHVSVPDSTTVRGGDITGRRAEICGWVLDQWPRAKLNLRVMTLQMDMLFRMSRIHEVVVQEDHALDIWQVREPRDLDSECPPVAYGASLSDT